MEANDNGFKKTNSVYKIQAIAWIKWAFALIIFFAERWDEIPKPSGFVDGENGSDTDNKPSAIPLDRAGIPQVDSGASVPRDGGIQE